MSLMNNATSASTVRTIDTAVLRAYFVCGSQDCPEGRALEIIEEALRSGVSIFQFREKGARSFTGDDKERFAREVQELCARFQVPFIVNDDIDLALRLNADGVHVGQDDADIVEVRSLFPDKIVGLSIRNIDEYHTSRVDVADYIGVGPIFATQSKADASQATGVELIREIKTLNPSLPIVAIGGITLDNCSDVAAAGADGLAVISMITRSDDIAGTVESMLGVFEA